MKEKNTTPIVKTSIIEVKNNRKNLKNCLSSFSASLQQKKQKEIFYVSIFILFRFKSLNLKRERSSTTTNSLFFSAKKKTNFNLKNNLKQKRFKLSRKKLFLISLFFLIKLTKRQKQVSLDLFLTVLFHSIKTYEFLINLKIILDYYPQINPYIFPVGWLTFLTEEPIAIFGWLMPPFIRPYADLRATLLLMILEKSAPYVYAFRDEIRYGEHVFD